MCQFFSIITTGNGIPKYFDVKQRKEIHETPNCKWQWDSHASLADYYKLNEDKCNKYEYNIFAKKFVIDQLNNKSDDSDQIKKWCDSFDFTEIIMSGYYHLRLDQTCPKEIKLPEHIFGDSNFEGWQGSANNLQSIGGHAYFEGWQGSANALQSIGWNAYFEDWKHYRKDINVKHNIYR